MVVGGQSIPEQGPHPLELYRELNRFYTQILPSLCQEPGGMYREMPSCRAFRAAREENSHAPFPIGPLAAVQEFGDWSRANRNRMPPEASAGLVENPCGQPDSSPRPLTPFPIERAYPDTAMASSLQGVVMALVIIDATGVVTGVEFASAHPAGVFESAVEREIWTLRFEPGTSSCGPVAGTVALPISFVVIH